VKRTRCNRAPAGGIPFEEKMESLKAHLLEQFEKGEELKEKIKANFERI